MATSTGTRTITETARAFFDACETGKGWEGCSTYCQPGASFSAQAEPLADVHTLKDYTEWMKGLLVFIPDGRYEGRKRQGTPLGKRASPMRSSGVWADGVVPTTANEQRLGRTCPRPAFAQTVRRPTERARTEANETSVTTRLARAQDADSAAEEASRHTLPRTRPMSSPQRMQFVCAQAAWFSGIHPATERVSEPERRLILAILATRHGLE